MLTRLVLIILPVFCIYLTRVISASPLPHSRSSSEVNVDILSDLLGVDMLFLPQSRSGKKGLTYRWNNKTVPYVLDPKFNLEELANIKNAMSEIESQTCIRFRQKDNRATDFINIKASVTGCNSYVGRIGGSQDVNLQSPACSTHKGATMHELIHAIGFEHEQNRSDRDEYVSIVWSNVQDGYQFAFDKLSRDKVDDYGIPYDYHSVMHYYKYAFAKDKDQVTMIPKQKGVELYYVTELSKYDAMKINKMYGC